MVNERPHPAKLRRALRLKRHPHAAEQIIHKLKTAEKLTTPQAAMSPGQHLCQALPMDVYFASAADGRRHMFLNVIDLHRRRRGDRAGGAHQPLLITAIHPQRHRPQVHESFKSGLKDKVLNSILFTTVVNA